MEGGRFEGGWWDGEAEVGVRVGVGVGIVSDLGSVRVMEGSSVVGGGVVCACGGLLFGGLIYASEYLPHGRLGLMGVGALAPDRPAEPRTESPRSQVALRQVSDHELNHQELPPAVSFGRYFETSFRCRGA